MKKSILFVICCLLCSCTATELQFNQVSLHAMVGKTQSDVIRLLGQPNESFVKNGVTYYIYTTQYKNYTPPTSDVSFTPESITVVEGYYTPATCTTIFEIEKSIVNRVNTKGTCL